MSGQNLDEVIKHAVSKTKSLTDLKMPRKYKVLLLNDDYTPMDFVVEVLKHFFHLNEENAIQVMLQVHFQGIGLCGIFTRDIAETKITLVNEYSKMNQHPLLAKMEPE